MFFNNYRPIYLSSVFSKIIERLMYTHLLNFIDKHKILNKLQFGFRNNHSTVMALAVLIANLVEVLDNGKCAVGILLDFRKHLKHILLDKLYCYSKRGTAHKWFVSYLSSRQQSIKYNVHESELKLMRCGVPQRSTLGPLHFLSYIHDLTNVSVFSADTFCWWYQSFFCTGTDLKDMIRQINEDMVKIHAWVDGNKLSLNIDKTNFMLFMPKSFSHCADHIVIHKI